MKRLSVILARHTETTWNAEKRYSGQGNPPLNDVGRQQAAALAQALHAKKFVAIFSSDLSRARETVEIIAAPHCLTPNPDPRIREVSVGLLDGMLFTEARQKFPEEYFSTRSLTFDFRKIGGESRQEVIARQRNFLDEIAEVYGAAEKPYPEVLLVGYGTAFRTLLQDLGSVTEHTQGSFSEIVYP